MILCRLFVRRDMRLNDFCPGPSCQLDERQCKLWNGGASFTFVYCNGKQFCRLTSIWSQNMQTNCYPLHSQSAFGCVCIRPLVSASREKNWLKYFSIFNARNWIAWKCARMGGREGIFDESFRSEKVSWVHTKAIKCLSLFLSLSRAHTSTFIYLRSSISHALHDDPFFLLVDAKGKQSFV